MAPRPSEEVNIMIEFMKQMQGLRTDMNHNSGLISNKLDAQTVESREEFKELRLEVSDIKIRLAKGSERIENMKKEIDEKKITCRGHELEALEKKINHDEVPTEVATAKKPLPWWLVLILGGAATWIGEQSIKVFVNAIADKPAVIQPVKP